MSLVVLDHVGLDPRTDVDARTDLDYRRIERALNEGHLDAAIISAGVARRQVSAAGIPQQRRPPKTVPS
jgi:hypothetical protein